MEMRKVLVKEGDIAIATCPFCLKTKKLSVTKYKQKGKRELKIKCSCEETFAICLECRKHPRKSVKLVGKCINLSNHREAKDVVIKNISLGGIGFRPFQIHRTRKDNLLQVSFTLNDVQHTPIDTQLIVRFTTYDHVGCEFKSTEKFRTSLGFYLIS